MRWRPINQSTIIPLKELMTDEEIAIYNYTVMKARGKRILSYIDPFWMRYMLKRDGVSVYDIGRKSHQFNLARHNDTGPYTVENARFITSKENQAEKNAHWSTPSRHTYIIEGIEYPHYRDVMEAHGCSKQVVYSRVWDPNHPDWTRVPK